MPKQMNPVGKMSHGTHRTKRKPNSKFSTPGALNSKPKKKK